jgi:cytochrome c oxidase assembly protein subunit 11
MGRNRMVVLSSLVAIAFMVGLVAASVPLYQMFCRVTGYGGATKVAAGPSATRSERMVTVRFDASLAKDMTWRFKPAQKEIRVQLGQDVLALFTASNPTDQPITGTATFNVTPEKAGKYFNKIECFCFTEQRLEPGQSVDMPVTFFVDPALATDRNTEEVTTITLSYTFFRVAKAAHGRRASAAPPPPTRAIEQANANRQGRS